MKKIVGWDLDGTLINTEPLIKKTLSTLFGKEVVVNIYASPYQNIKRNGYEPSKYIREYWNHYYRFLNYAEPFNGIYDTLETLNQEGIESVVITSLADSAAKKLLKQFELEKYFTIVLGGSKKEFKKPSRKSIEYCLQQSESEKHCFYYVGDSVSDKIFSSNAGVKFIHAGWNQQCQANSDYSITDPKEILSIVIEDK